MVDPGMVSKATSDPEFPPTNIGALLPGRVHLFCTLRVAVFPLTTRAGRFLAGNDICSLAPVKAPGQTVAG